MLVAFGNVVFFGKSIVLTDNYNPLENRFSNDTYGKNFVPASVWARRGLMTYPNFHDPGGAWWQWEPGAVFLRKGLARGELPFWDPYVGAGAPAMVNLTSGFFFPPYWLVVLAGNTSLAKNLYFLGLVFLAGLFTYLFLRQHEVAPLPSSLGAAAFMLSGGMVQTMGSLVGQNAACLPLALYLTRRFLDRPTWRGAALLALGYALIALASFPPVLLGIFGLAAAYVAAMIWPSPRNEWKAEIPRRMVAAQFLAAVGLSVGMVAFYYLPAALLHAKTPQIVQTYKGASEAALPLLCLYQLVSPVLMGGPHIYANPAMPIPSGLHLFYSGISVTLLALLPYPSLPEWKRRLAIFARITAGLLILKIFGVAPIQWLGTLPGLNTIHFAAYFGIHLNFVLAVLAALGLEAALERRMTRAHTAVPPIACALILSGLWQVADARGVFGHPASEIWISHWRRALAFGVFTILAVLVVYSRRSTHSLRKAFVLGLVAAVAMEGVLFAMYPRQYRWDVWRHPVAYVRHLTRESSGGRVFASASLPANASSAFEIFGLDSIMTVNSPRMFEFYKRYFDPGASLFLRQAQQLPPERVLDCANIEQVASQESIGTVIGEAILRGYPLTFNDGYVRVFRRKPPPRYYFTSLYRVVPTREALEAVKDPAGEREIVLETRPAFPSAPNLTTDPAVLVSEFRRNRYRLVVDAPRQGMLYCSVTNFPGWTVRVDGKPARISAANYAFSAVELPAGRSVVEFRYWPPGLTPSSAASLSFLAATVLLTRPRRPNATGKGAR